MNQSKVHPSTKDLNVYPGYESNPIGSGQKSESTKQNPSVKGLHRPNKAPMGGNEASMDRSHVTSGPQTSANYNQPAPFTKRKA